MTLDQKVAICRYCIFISANFDFRCRLGGSLPEASIDFKIECADES
jgi:hypothetical protein